MPDAADIQNLNTDTKHSFTQGELISLISCYIYIYNSNRVIKLSIVYLCVLKLKLFVWCTILCIKQFVLPGMIFLFRGCGKL